MRAVSLSLGPLPGVSHRLAIEDREDRSYEQQDGFVDGAGYREQPDGGDPAKRPGDSGVASKHRHRPDRPADDGG